MATHIDAILDALEAMTVTGHAYPVYRGSTLKNVVDIASVPCRILSAIDGISSGSQTRRTGGGAVMVTLQWTIQDIALIRHASLGIGLRDVAPSMESYIDAYHTAVWGLYPVQLGWSIAGVTARNQVLEWPAASGNFFDAVVASVTVADIITT